MSWYDNVINPMAYGPAGGGVGAYNTLNGDSPAGAALGAIPGYSNPLDQFGLPSQFQDRQQIMNNINAGLGRQAPTVDQSQSDYWRRMQQQQAQQLMGVASGQRQGAGELAAQRQTQNALASQQAMARMARGSNSGMAYRNAANNSAGIGMSGAGLSQQAALQDQQTAQQQLLQALGGARGQDQQNAFANQQANLSQQQIGMGYNGQLIGMDQAQLNAAVAAQQSKNQLLGGLISQGGQMGGAAMMAG